VLRKKHAMACVLTARMSFGLLKYVLFNKINKLQPHCVPRPGSGILATRRGAFPAAGLRLVSNTRTDDNPRDAINARISAKLGVSRALPLTSVTHLSAARACTR
jgi:hypothetical protein